MSVLLLPMTPTAVSLTPAVPMGAALESSLHPIISTGVTRLSYDGVWNALKVTDRDPSSSAR